jgi:hypothetical protein
MKKTMLVLAMVVAALLMAGCSELTSQGDEAEGQSPKKQQASPEREKTVVVKEKTVEVDEGMSKKEEKELQQRLDELEEKIDDKTKQKSDDKEASQPDQEVQSTEEQALEAAQDYYAAAAAGDYNYTYDALSSASQSQLTEEEWVAANTTLGSDAGIYRIDSTNVVDDSTVVVYLTITSADGSSSERITQFILENGSWKHDLTQEEYALFAGALGSATASASASSSASASASGNASASATGNTKHVKIVITSDKPADVSINDDSMNWFITEEVVGTETYEKNIAADSGLSVSATTDAYHAQTTIEVYENGELVAQDSDPNGLAMVNY